MLSKNILSTHYYIRHSYNYIVTIKKSSTISWPAGKRQKYNSREKHASCHISAFTAFCVTALVSIDLSH